MYGRTPEKPGGLDHLLTAGWTAELEGLRINGIEVNVTRGRLRPDGRHVSVIDTGAAGLFIRMADFEAVVPLFNGPTTIEIQPNNETVVWFQCDQPQLLEFKFRGEWFAVDPLDLIEANADRTVNGMQMCVHQILRFCHRLTSVLGVYPRCVRTNLLFLETRSWDCPFFGLFWQFSTM